MPRLLLSRLINSMMAASFSVLGITVGIVCRQILDENFLFVRKAKWTQGTVIIKEKVAINLTF